MRKNKKILLTVFIIVLLSVAVFSAYKIVSIVMENRSGDETYEQAKEVADFKGDSLAGQLKDYRVDFDALKGVNDDVQGWLVLPDSTISYPVVQGKDNSRYLTRLYTGEINGKGSIFVDYRCKADFAGHKTVIYGHHMQDGSMFAGLLKYRSKDYYKKHKYMVLITPKETYRIDVFASMTIRADSSFYETSEMSKDERSDEIIKIKRASDIDTGVAVKASDRILMLSTCAYDFDEARYVVFAKVVE